MKKARRMISLLLVVIIAAATLPGAFSVSGVKADKTDYVIWQASTDLFLSDGGSVSTAVTGDTENKFAECVKAYEEDGSYYSAALTQNKYRSVVRGSIDSSSSGFGWMANKAVLNALAPYMYVGFDYRINSDASFPSDTQLILNAVTETGAVAAELAHIGVNSACEWTVYQTAKIKSSSFSNVWSNGLLSFSLTSASGNLDGDCTVDIKNVVLIMKDSDKSAINAALKKVSGIDNITNFTKGVYLGTGKNKKYFQTCFTGFDETTSVSGRNASDSHTVTAISNDKCEIAVSRTLAKGTDANNSDAVTVDVKLAANYNIKSVIAKANDGTEVKASASVKNSKYIFNMPAADVTVTAETVYESERELTWLWKAHNGTYGTNPWYAGTSGWNCSYARVDGGDQTAFKFNITKAEGAVLVYGSQNANVTASRYYDTAYFYTELKLETESADRTVKIGVTDGKVYEVQVPDTDEYTQVKIPLKDISSGADIGTFKVYFDNRSIGDSIYVGESFVFNKELDCTVKEAWNKILDMSDYEKKESNTLLGVIGDTEGLVDPWCENRSTVGNVVNWDIAWYYSFQNIAPYILIPDKDLISDGKDYFTTFYGDTIDATDYVDTGYLEFFIQCDKDGIEVPFAVEASGHANRTFAEFKVKYDKSNARADGYMCVRVPFTYFSDAGLNIDKICRITVKGLQSSLLCEYFLISSFRFYSNYADVPEPEPIVEEEPEPERDMPVDFDEKVINGKLDKENKILYVPGDTQIWEVLSALSFDTDETNVDFYDGKFIDDEATVVTENMKLAIYRRGYLLDQFSVKLLTEEITETVTVSEDEYSDEDYEDFYGDDGSYDEESDGVSDIAKTGDDSAPFTAITVLLASLAVSVLIMLYRKKQI